MIKYCFRILFLLAIAHPSFSQKKSRDTLVRYFNEYLKPVKKKEAVFVGVIIRDQLGWNALIYDDSMRILVRGKYADETCLYKQGWFMYYYANGNRASGGRYVNNLRVDNWKTWYPGGQLKDSFLFVNDAAEGAARSYHESGKVAADGIFKNGNYDGYWTFYHENSQPSTKERYKDGKLAELECFDSAGQSTGFSCAISRPPVPAGRSGGIEQYFKDSLVIPLMANREPVEGFVNVEFNITKAGALTDYRVLSSTDVALTKEATRVLASIKQWYPAVSHNRLVDFKMMLSIPFFVYDPGKRVEQIIPPFDENQF